MTIKQIQKIKNTILQNKEGFTIDLKGNIVNKNKGYFIGITNIKGKNLNHLIKKVLYVYNIGFKGNQNIFIGGWCDRENNFYLDLSLYSENLNFSKKVGLIFKQQAIFNINKCDSVYLK